MPETGLAIQADEVMDVNSPYLNPEGNQSEVPDACRYVSE